MPGGQLVAFSGWQRCRGMAPPLPAALPLLPLPLLLPLLLLVPGCICEVANAK